MLHVYGILDFSKFNVKIDLGRLGVFSYSEEAILLLSMYANLESFM